MIFAYSRPDMSEASTWPIWLVTLITFAAICLLVYSIVTSRMVTSREKEISAHERAWSYLARMAPVLARRETFGEFYFRTSIGEYPRYPESTHQSNDIDHKRIIVAGEQYEERKKYNKVYSDLKTLDKILEPLRPEDKKEEKNDD